MTFPSIQSVSVGCITVKLIALVEGQIDLLNINILFWDVFQKWYRAR